MKMNKAKFPPKWLYIFWSSFSLIALFILYNRLSVAKENFLSYIGRHAIFYYFAQGLSSSLIYFIVVPLVGKIPWALQLVLIFSINVVLAVGIAELLKRLDAFGWRVLRFLHKKTAS